ncbi:AN1-type zinc finger protein 5 isoform X2 [Parus major]|uniref:AN1-type zinc finger protein 5 isoform X2 n=1 Tax=Parus major TaxID=9157 RepID=UPI001444235C|nr:AN1-type zinc finger protein 5 isoform X2 [Parus major]
MASLKLPQCHFSMGCSCSRTACSCIGAGLLSPQVSHGVTAFLQASPCSGGGILPGLWVDLCLLVDLQGLQGLSCCTTAAEVLPPFLVGHKGEHPTLESPEIGSARLRRNFYHFLRELLLNQVHQFLSLVLQKVKRELLNCRNQRRTDVSCAGRRLALQDLTADVETYFVDFTVILTSIIAHMIIKQKLQQKSEKRIQLWWLKKFREYKLICL